MARRVGPFRSDPQGALPPATALKTKVAPLHILQTQRAKCCSNKWDFSNYESQFMSFSEATTWRRRFAETCNSVNATAHRRQPISSAAPTGPIKVGTLEISVRRDSILSPSQEKCPVNHVLSDYKRCGKILPALWIMKSLPCIWATVNDRLVNLVLRWPSFFFCCANLSCERPHPSVCLSVKYESQEVITAGGCPIEMCRWDK